jgi:hypothetical protein
MSDICPPTSKIEDILSEMLEYFLAPEVQVDRGYPIVTQCGRYCLDFKIECPLDLNPAHGDSKRNVKLGIECDGRKYHHWESDFWRDSLILGTGEVDEIIKITGRQIYLYTYSCVFQIGLWYPWLLGGRCSSTGKSTLADLGRFSRTEFIGEHGYSNTQQEEYGKHLDFTNGKNYEIEDIFKEKFLQRTSVSCLYSITPAGSLESLFEYQTPFPVVEKVTWKDCYDYAFKHGSGNLQIIISDFKCGVAEQGNELIPEI